ncbi:MAG: sulfatase-like hydrolase/transferase [Planctomycetales bacterium]|nr:sulfatase-like hydrolase/transferase [Planctomycetales bacterium]
MRLATCLIPMLVLLWTSTISAADRQPNIIVVLSDDAGYHDFSIHGSDTPTPRIDSIAQRGARFTDGYVSGCVCSPTRAGLLTGRYQQRFGHEFNIPPVYSDTNGLPLDEILLPSVLQAAGYRTIALGKWHLGYAPHFHPLARGFTDYYGFLQGARSYWPLEKPTKLNQLLRDRDPVFPEPFEYMTDHLADEAVKYLADAKDQPFLMYVAFNATHGPQHATHEDLERVNGRAIPAMTVALDRAVGKLLDALDEHKLAENTLLFFLNDNGGTPRHDNEPLRGHKGTCWEGGIRVPFLVQWPAQIRPGQTIDAPVISLDIFPTALAAAGIKHEANKPVDGVNLLPLLTSSTPDHPQRTLYWKSGPKWAVRHGNLKLCAGDPKHAEKPLLFDLAQDMSETTDLSEQRPADVKRLLDLYHAWASTHVETPWARGRDR